MLRYATIQCSWFTSSFLRTKHCGILMSFDQIVPWLAGWVGVYSMPAAARYFSISSLLAAIPGGIMLAICALRPICGCGAALVLYDQYVARLRAAYPTGSHLGPRISRDTTHFVSKPPTLYHQSFVAFFLQLSGRDSRSLSFQYCFTE